jgi:hypothetical protein
VLRLVCGVAFPQRQGKGAASPPNEREHASGVITKLRRNIDTSQGAIDVQIKMVIHLNVTFERPILMACRFKSNFCELSR